MNYLTKKTVQSLIPIRKKSSYKGDYGKVLLIGGNESMGGAVMLNALAAVYSGAGLVTVVTAKSNHAALHAQLPEAMVIDWNNQHQIEAQLNTATVIAIGSGMGTSQESLALLNFIFSHITNDQRIIIDGSAITLMAKYNIAVPNQQTIFTPHLGEWKRLSGLEPRTQLPRLNQIKRDQLNAIIVLKQHRTEIYFKDEIWQNQAGNPAMATGGMGDTLVGILAGMIAQLSNLKAGILVAVFLHSYIGDQLAEKQYVVLPSQIIQQLPVLLKELADSNN